VLQGGGRVELASRPASTTRFGRPFCGQLGPKNGFAVLNAVVDPTPGDPGPPGRPGRAGKAAESPRRSGAGYRRRTGGTETSEIRRYGRN